MSTLLGLQTTPLDFGSEELGLAANATKDGNPGLDALLKDVLAKDAEDGKSSKKELAPWNLIFPGMAPNPNALEANNMPVVNKTDGAQAPTVDALLAKVGLARIDQDPSAQSRPGMVRVDANTPELHGARILQVETFGSQPFAGSTQHLQAQSALVASNPQVVSQQAAAGRYSQVARGDSEVAMADSFSADAAPVDNGARKIVDAKTQGTVDLTAAALAANGHAHATGQATDTQATNAIVTPHSVPNLMQKVGTMAHAGGGQMTVALSPPELGKVEVQVTTRGKRVEIKITSDSSAAKSVLESGMADLRRQLEGQNLTLTRSEVNVSREHFGSNLQQQQQHFANHQQFQQQSGHHSGRGDERGMSLGGGFGREPRSIERVSQVSARRVAVAPGRVDVRI